MNARTFAVVMVKLLGVLLCCAGLVLLVALCQPMPLHSTQHLLSHSSSSEAMVTDTIFAPRPFSVVLPPALVCFVMGVALIFWGRPIGKLLCKGLDV